MAYQNSVLHPDFKLGVLGGGQLGKMMALAAGNWHLPLYLLDQSPDFPAGREVRGLVKQVKRQVPIAGCQCHHLAELPAAQDAKLEIGV